MRFLGILAALAAAMLASHAAAQSAVLTANSTALVAEGGQVTITVNVTFTGNPAIFSLEVAAPSDWSYVSGTGEPVIRPSPGARAATGALLSWTDLARLSSPVRFSFVLSYPAGTTTGAVTSSVTLRQVVAVTVIDKNTGAQTTENRDVRTDLAPAAITFMRPPTILTQPDNATASVGSATNIRVAAGGGTPLAYQWYKDGAVVAGQTNAMISFPAAQLVEAGSYTVVVSNSAGSVTSGAATLTVLPAAGGGGGGGGGAGGGGGGGGGGVATGTAPAIASLTPSQAVAEGGAVALRVSATGTAPLIYQWRKNGVAIAGATGATLDFPAVQPTDAASYSVLVSNAAGAVTSSTVVLTVTAAPPVVAPVPPTISSQSPGTSISSGSAVTLAVTATGATPLTYQWFRNGQAVAGGTGATLAIGNAAPGDSGAYTVIVANRVGSVASAPIALQVVPASTAPVIVTQPLNVTTVAGARVNLVVEATGTTPLGYQWRRNGVPIPGATGASLVVGSAEPSDAGDYTVVVSNAVGSATSNSASLTLVPVPTAPVITVQPVTQAAVPGASVGFSVMAQGTAPFTYQWWRNGVALAGATARTLALASLRATDAGSYSVSVANSVGSVTSGTATLTVAPPPGLPVIVAEPADVTIGAGARVTLRVSAGGTPPFTYEWRKNGTAIANSEVLTLANVQAGSAGIYTVVVSNALGSATSRAAALTIRGRSYVGSYFGSFANGGSFALVVRDDNTGVFLGYATGSRTAVVSRDVAVDESGRFRVVTVVAAATRDGMAAAANEITLEGAIDANGGVAGSAGGLNTTLTGSRSAATGSTQEVAGFYQGGVPGSAATTYTIVSPAGQAFVLAVSATGADAGTGTVDAAGRMAVTTAGGATVTGVVSESSRTLAASLTTSTGVRQEFSGGSDARLATEKLVNIATRGPVGGTAGALIAGFVVAGSTPKQVLVRAVGPTLGSFGVSGALAAARLELFRGSTSIATNSGWGATSHAAEIIAAAQRAGAFALDASSRDAVLLVTLEPGAYTAVVSGEGGASGVALVEVYDVSAATANPPRVINIASRAFAGSGDSTLTAGFVVDGTVPKRVLVRGVGPGLAAFGVGGTLADPQLKLFRGETVVATNDNWGSGAEAGAIAGAATGVGAFALNPGSNDAALLLNLAPGPYTVQLSGAGNATGTALIEVYEAP